jgi:ADP-ribose pyrophosphatase YjhB (NUDIX family)
MLDFTHFIHCPACAGTHITTSMHNGMRCVSCGFIYFHNTAAAVAGIIEHNGGILLTRRNQEPQKGLWDLPGGFVDYHETAENALAREVAEELHCTIESCRYLCSFPNTYSYASVDYCTCDMIFVCTLVSGQQIIPNNEIMEISCIQKTDIDWNSLAFPSIRAALTYYVSACT